MDPSKGRHLIYCWGLHSDLEVPFKGLRGSFWVDIRQVEDSEVQGSHSRVLTLFMSQLAKSTQGPYKWVVTSVGEPVRSTPDLQVPTSF